MSELSEEAKAELHDAIHIVRTDKFESWFRKAHPGQPMPDVDDKTPKPKDKAPKDDKTPPKKEEIIDPPKPRKGLWAVGFEGDDNDGDS